jgi:chemotaxis protein MotA
MSAKKVMDTASVGGLALAFFSLIVSMILEFGHLNPDFGSAFLQLSALLIIFGGTFGAVMASVSMEDVIKIPTLMKIAFYGEHHDPKELIATVVKLAELARREGVLSLESRMEELQHTYPFLALGFRHVVDGQTPEKLKEILADELFAMEERHNTGVALFTALGGYAPTMGIIGTVCGLISALSLAGHGGGDPSHVVAAIATAFIATFYGIASANLCFLPIGAKLQLRSQHEVFMKLVQAHAVLSIQNGDNPRTLGAELRVFFRKEQVGEEGE